MMLGYHAWTTERAMTINLRPATDSDVRELATWQYDPPYDVYDITMNPDKAVAYFLGPGVHCYTLLDGNDVAGYCTFGHDAQVPGGNYDEDGLDIGLGIEPARTGRGEGHRYVTAVVAHASATFEPRQLRADHRYWQQASPSCVVGCRIR